MANNINDNNDFNGIDISSGRVDPLLDGLSNRIKRVNFNTFSSSDYATNEAYKSLRTNIFFCGADVKTMMKTRAKAQYRPSLQKALQNTASAHCL